MKPKAMEIKDMRKGGAYEPTKGGWKGVYGAKVHNFVDHVISLNLGLVIILFFYGVSGFGKCKYPF